MALVRLNLESSASFVPQKQRFTPTAGKALQEDFRFSQDRKNKSPEAQTEFSVHQNTTQESSLFFPLRKSQGLSSRSRTNPQLKVESVKDVPLIFSPVKKISQTGSPASQISCERTNLSSHLSSCLPNVQTQPAMQQIPVVSTSTPLTWGVEDFSFPGMEEFQVPLMMEQDIQSIYSTPSTMGVENFPSTGRSPCRGFNTPTSTLNTQDIMDLKFEENFEEFFSRNDFGNEAMKTNETPIDDSVKIEYDFNQPEEIWGINTFNDDEEFEVCAPPSIVEGAEEDSTTGEDLFTLEAPVLQLAEQAPQSSFDIETNDVLQWIIDDQQIEDLPIFEECKTEVTPELHNVPISSPQEVSESSSQTKVKVKSEDLGEDEKYRKMRIQNNEASRKCRQNRKRKQQDMEEECKLLEERNVFLKSRLEDMGMEVKVWKKKFLMDIKNTSAQMFQF